MSKEKSYTQIAIRAVITFVVFFAVLGILNFFNDTVNLYVVDQITQYLNLNVTILVAMFIVAIAAQIINKLKFPLNLPAPIIQAIPIVFAVRYCIMLLVVVAATVGKDIYRISDKIASFINPIIFLLILIFGYISIIKRIITGRKHESKKKDSNDGGEEK